VAGEDDGSAAARSTSTTEFRTERLLDVQSPAQLAEAFAGTTQPNFTYETPSILRSTTTASERYGRGMG
jgi:hypothetical protein